MYGHSANTEDDEIEFLNFSFHCHDKVRSIKEICWCLWSASKGEEPIFSTSTMKLEMQRLLLMYFINLLLFWLKYLHIQVSVDWLQVCTLMTLLQPGKNCTS